ncbi:TPA: hypothetical protein ACGSV8_003860 [Shigella flexneri]
MFQQRNVLASWLATGCGVALYLALTARTRSLTLICLLSLYPLSTALVLTQSRVGLLGLFCASGVWPLSRTDPAGADVPLAVCCA